MTTTNADLKTTLERYISEREPELAKLDRINAEVEAAKEMLRKIQELDSSAFATVFNKTIPAVERAPQENGYGEAAKAIREAIEDCGTTYTIDDVEKVMRSKSSNMSRDAISQTLSRLSRIGQINVQTRGAGRRPTVYTKQEQIAA